MDEFQYWGDMARSDERASQFVDLFKPISKEFGGLDTMDMMDVMELVEIAQDTLDDVWKCVDFDAYPEPRMKHLMDIIGMMTSVIIFNVIVLMDTKSLYSEFIAWDLKKEILVDFSKKKKKEFLYMKYGIF